MIGIGRVKCKSSKAAGGKMTWAALSITFYHFLLLSIVGPKIGDGLNGTWQRWQRKINGKKKNIAPLKEIRQAFSEDEGTQGQIGIMKYFMIFLPGNSKGLIDGKRTLFKPKLDLFPVTVHSFDLNVVECQLLTNK